MLLVLHITVALTGLILSTASVFKPSHNIIKLSFGLVAATIASGTYLVISTHSSMLSSCITGLIYTSATLSLIITAQRRLVSVKTKIED